VRIGLHEGATFWVREEDVVFPPTKYAAHSPSQEDCRPALPASTELTQENMVRELLTIYWQAWAAKTIDPDRRIRAFRIESIDRANPTEDGFELLATVSLQAVPPLYLRSAWLEGVGEYAADGWVLNKLFYVHIVRDGEVYSIDTLKAR